MNRLSSKASEIADQHAKYCSCSERDFLNLIKCEANLIAWKVPFIQYQAFAEKAHYYWLCLTKGVAI